MFSIESAFAGVSVASLPAPSRRPAAPALEFASLAQWTRAALTLTRRRASAKNYALARGHWLALPLVLIDSAEAGACRDFLWLLDAGAGAQSPWGKPVRGQRGKTKWEAANVRARNRLERLARRADPSGALTTAPRRGASHPFRHLPLDRAAILKDAHKRFRDAKRLALELSFADCLKTAWAAARVNAARLALVSVHRLESF